MNIRFRKQFFNEFEGSESSGGGAVDAGSPAPATVPAEAAPASPPAPASMLEAISAHLDAQQPTTAAGQPRDELGRFAQKNADGTPMSAEQQAAAGIQPPAGQAPAKPGDQALAKPEAPEDLLKMPEGLQPKAQERFQALANTNKDLTSQVEQLRTQVDYVRETFQTHGIQQPQFEQAAAFIGAVNRGDLQGALAVLDEQRRQISLALGQPLPGVDALAEFPDLRQAVDNLQVTEAHAMELARSRAMQQAQQRQTQEVQQAQRAKQAEAQAVQVGTAAVDRLCQQLQSQDLDYPVIEAQLLPVIPQLLQGVPPKQWENVVRLQYDLIKKAVASSRVAAPQARTSQPLRPSGQGGAPGAPKTMFDAMWNR